MFAPHYKPNMRRRARSPIPLAPWARREFSRWRLRRTNTSRVEGRREVRVAAPARVDDLAARYRLTYNRDTKHRSAPVVGGPRLIQLRETKP